VVSALGAAHHRLWLIAVSVAVLVVAVAFVRSQQATQRAARASCERSREFGPPLADAYGKYGILNDRQLKAYRATLPKSCP
jgi:hypothetical protein